MRRVFTRQVLGYVLGLLTAFAGFAVGGVAFAGHSATGVTAGGSDNTLTACESQVDGSLYLVDRGKKTDGCRKRDTTVMWSITGPQGPQGIQGIQGPKGDQGARGADGSVSKAVSPNGVFTITLSNAGILLKGPNGDVHVDFAGVRMNTIGGQP
jgi:hypothetical protein